MVNEQEERERSALLNQRVRWILDSIFDGVYITDRRRRIVFWNKGAERLTGFSPQEVQGRWCGDNLLNHIDAEGNLLCTGRCPLENTIETGEPAQAKVYPRAKDGTRFPVYTHIGAIKDSDGRPIAGIEVFRDVTSEEQYRQLQEKFQALIRKYVSEGTYEEVLEQVNSGEGTEARQCDMTVLFLDIVSFTTFAESNSPEEVSQLLNEVFGICEVITSEAHGDIDKFIGDAVMATFFDADDAVSAAMKIIDALARLNETRVEVGKDPVQVRIGLNSGPVIRGEIGTQKRRDLTVLGDTVNVASRIQETANPESILISEATLARLTRDYGFRERGSVKVKGRTQPVVT